MENGDVCMGAVDCYWACCYENRCDYEAACSFKTQISPLLKFYASVAIISAAVLILVVVLCVRCANRRLRMEAEALVATKIRLYNKQRLMSSENVCGIQSS